MTQPQVVQPDLFSVPRARRTDPETSRQAANSISFDRLTRTQELVLNGLRAQGPATDEELLAPFRSRCLQVGPLINPFAVGARSSFVKGRVADSGDRRKTKHGQKSTVWRAVE